MRTTKDLIAELEAQGHQHQHTAIVVGFESSTVPIFVTDYNRLELLNDAVSVGGSPLGLIAFDQSDHELRVVTHIYPENTGDKRVQADLCLKALSERVRHALSVRWWKQDNLSGQNVLRGLRPCLQNAE